MTHNALGPASKRVVNFGGSDDSGLEVAEIFYEQIAVTRVEQSGRLTRVTPGGLPILKKFVGSRCAPRDTCAGQETPILSASREGQGLFAILKSKIGMRTDVDVSIDLLFHLGILNCRLQNSNSSHKDMIILPQPNFMRLRRLLQGQLNIATIKI